MLEEREEAEQLHFGWLHPFPNMRYRGRIIIILKYGKALLIIEVFMIFLNFYCVLEIYFYYHLILIYMSERD